MSGETKFDQERWLRVFNENYYGESHQAKELSNFLKDAYKGGSYIPWAVMQRMLYQQDPTTEFKVHENIFGNGFIYTDTAEITSYQSNDDKVAETRGTALSHCVKVSVTFLGKTVVEIYPIQDSKVKGASYTAPKAYDQNLLNNAIKRGLSKAASLASGLALSLYENGDLQFADIEKSSDDTPNVLTPPKTEKEENTETTATKETVIEGTDKHLALAKYLSENKDALEKGIKLVNTSVFKGHGFTVDLKEPVEEIANKLAHFEDAEKFVNAVKYQSGVK